MAGIPHFSMYTMAQALAEEGLVAPECTKVELLMPENGTMILRYEVAVMEADIPKIVRALARVNQEALP